MHYKNGREAKPGDKVINLTYGFSGILHSVNAGSTTCNGRLATISQNDPYVTLSECLHQDDVAAADVPDQTKKSGAAGAVAAALMIALMVIVLGLGSGCVFGKKASTPTSVESKMFTIVTNQVPQVVQQTNTVFQTNVVQEVHTVTQTNQVGVPVEVQQTNYHTVEIPKQVVTTVTNFIAVPQLTGPSAITNTATTVASGVAGMFGWGGVVSTVLGGLLAGYMKLRNRALAGQATILNQTAGALTQNIETLLNVLQSTPQGAAVMPQIKNYLMAHQTETGVIQSVAAIIEQFVNEPAAKQSAAEIVQAINTIQAAPVKV
jgi:hypothetical protein